MLKVKKKINKNKNIIQNDDISKAQTDLKNSIKNLFIDGQKKKILLQKLERNMLNYKMNVMN